MDSLKDRERARFASEMRLMMEGFEEVLTDGDRAWVRAIEAITKMAATISQHAAILAERTDQIQRKRIELEILRDAIAPTLIVGGRAQGRTRLREAINKALDMGEDLAIADWIHVLRSWPYFYDGQPEKLEDLILRLKEWQCASKVSGQRSGGALGRVGFTSGSQPRKPPPSSSPTRSRRPNRGRRSGR